MTEFLTMSEVASLLRVDRRTVKSWVESGRIIGAKFGRDWRFSRAAVDAITAPALPPAI